MFFLAFFLIYGRTCLDGYITKKMGISPLLYVRIGDCLPTFEVFSEVEGSHNMQNKPAAQAAGQTLPC